MKIDPRLRRVISREETLAHLERCEGVGLLHLIGRNKIDVTGE